MTDKSWIDVDLAALDANVASFRKILDPYCAICGVVKANTYGLGAVPIARRLVTNGVKFLAVYDIAQAEQLAAANIDAELLVLMPVEKFNRTDVLYRAAVSGRLHLTVHRPKQLQRLETTGHTFGCQLPVHLEIDTGSSQSGMCSSIGMKLLSNLPQRRYLRLAGVFSHPASADGNVEFTELQFERFKKFLAGADSALDPRTAIHFANTHAALRDERYHFSQVRLGIGLLGYGQHDLAPGSIISDMPPLVPTLRWTSQVSHVMKVRPGTPVGRGGQFTPYRAARLGVVPVGFADGYPSALANQAVVRVGPDQHAVPVRGAIDMQQMLIDLTKISKINVGSEVELISAEPTAPNALHKLAELAGVNCHELLCGLGSHVARRYINGHGEQSANVDMVIRTPEPDTMSVVDKTNRLGAA